MDKEFEKKVKQKRIRAIAVGVVVIAAVIYLLAGTKVEKADYTDSLNKEIETAQSLYASQKENVGNGEGKYAAYTLLKFEKDISKAEAVAKDEASEYTDKKLAYEQLKAQVSAFEKGTNHPVIGQDEAETLAAEKGRKEVKTELKDGKELVYTVEGKNLKQPTVMNLMAREEGPFYDEINDILADSKLQGQVISFYQDGSFGGKIRVQTSIYSEKETTGYAYKIDLGKGKLSFVSEAEINLDEQTAVFAVEEGGDYVVLTEKIHKDKKKETVDIEDELQTETSDGSTDDEATAGTQDGQQDGINSDGQQGNGGQSDSVQNGSSASKDDESAVEADKAQNIKVSIDIRCDTLSGDLSKLRDPALESYVPSDGIILSLRDVEVKKGTTVYEVLETVCRNKNIHMEAVYTPSYGADYVEGINYLYEFDAGEQSGWMYLVNDVFPNYGCSDYVLENGDAIVWAYTCDMGKDLGKQ